MKRLIFGAIALVLSAFPALATDNVLGQTTLYESYNGTTERCVRITPMPTAQYSSDDLKKEAELCAIDVYGPAIALCPKIWSTSAAIVFYDISEGKFRDDRAGFQSKICVAGKIAKFVAKDEIARLKFTMNQDTASATYTPSSSLYYHFSRYFDFSTAVPVAVWRSIDKSVLRNEVALGGRDLSAGQDALAPNHAAWSTIIDAIDDPSTYEKPGSYGTARDLFTADGTAAYGTIYDGGGTQYGPEMNGRVVFDTAENRYAAFLQTPAVTALNTDLPLGQTIRETLKRDDAVFTPEGREPRHITTAQLAFWMHDMAEILLIDSMLGQQDRPGNIDYREYFYWQKDGVVERERLGDQVTGKGNIPRDAQIILGSRLNDNDAAGRSEYDNHLMRLSALEALHHFDPVLFEKVQTLDADFQNQGSIYLWLRDSFGLEQDQTDMIVANTSHAAAVLRDRLTNGALRLDLKANGLFTAGSAGQ